MIFSQLIQALVAAGTVSYHVAFGQTVLAEKEFSLADRYNNPFVNTVMADNILLTLNYMKGNPKVHNSNWTLIDKPFSYSFKLNPGEVFAFHDDVLPQFKGKVVKTTNAHFNAQEGYKTDGWLFGDGVCHVASFINIVARNAGLLVDAPTKHYFANIPDVPREEGVSIYDQPGASTGDELQNLYITNNKKKPIAFVFDYKNKNLKVEITQLN